MRIGLSGSEKLVGQHLFSSLTADGHKVYPIVQMRSGDAPNEILWNHREDILERHKLEELDAVIHLAGEHRLSLARWSEQKKLEIIGNRVGSTEHLSRALARLRRPPRVFLSASAIGYYGHRGTERLDEDSPPGDDMFLSALCQEWERATKPAAEAGIRTIQMRFGIVLTPNGGILRSLLVPFRLGLGGRYGGRRQYLSWIGMEDVEGAVAHMLSDPKLEGPVNLTSPNPVTMTEFAQTLGRVLSRPVFLHMPPWLVRLLLGKVSDDAALMSVRAFPKRLLDAGYRFAYPELESYLRFALDRATEPTSAGGVQRMKEPSSPSSAIP